jgi:tRNA-splicing ligase RtcB
MRRIDQFTIALDKAPGMLVEPKVYVSEKIRLEEQALDQLRDAARLPSVVCALGMPDIHTGYGVPIGSVVGVTEIIVPAAVGYDINCGMRIVLTPLSVSEIKNLQELAHSIHRDVPLGEGMTNVRLDSKSFEKVIERGVAGYLEINTGNERLEAARRAEEEADDMRKIEDNGSMRGDSAKVSSRAFDRGKNQLGTLGGGNHFIEIQRVERIYDEDIARRFGLWLNQIVVMIHSGSRGFGHQVGDDYMGAAKRLNLSRSPSPHLCFLDLDSKEGQGYIAAMHSAANFAFVNRQIMCAFVRRELRHFFGEMALPIVYDVPHNIAKLEEHGGKMLWVHRKGATRAFPKSRLTSGVYSDVGQPVLIPGSMGTASYVLLGTEESRVSLHSVNHGAGRTMSRTAASGKGRHGKRREAEVSDEEFAESMRGIVLICADKGAIKEEAPSAYKDIDEVIEVVVGAGLAKPVARMVPLAVLKG